MIVLDFQRGIGFIAQGYGGVKTQGKRHIGCEVAERLYKTQG